MESSDDEIRAYASKLEAEGKGGEAFLLLSQHNLLDYCPRMHLRAVHLPCGTRGECFGGNCPKLPKNAKFRFNYNKPFA